MNLLDQINSAIHLAATSFKSMWHNQIEPFLANFLKAVASDEVKTLVPIAEGLAAQFIPAAVAAIKSGNTEGFLDAQWDLAQKTAEQASDLAIQVALTSVSTAAQMVLVSHPEVVAATAETHDPMKIVSTEPVPQPDPAPVAEAPPA